MDSILTEAIVAEFGPYGIPIPAGTGVQRVDAEMDAVIALLRKFISDQQWPPPEPYLAALAVIEARYRNMYRALSQALPGEVW